MQPRDRVRTVRIRAAASEFLRLRPLVVAAAAGTNAVVLFTSAAPRSQVMALGATMGTGCLLMTIESFILRKRQVTEDWLVVTLGLTLLLLGLAASLSGGARSPVMPLLLAPVVVATAALGREPRGWLVFAVAAVTLFVVSFLPPLMPPLPPEQLPVQVAVACVATGVLAWLALTGLGEAQVGATEAADALRERVLGEASARAREAEGLGARVAHELRNPLTAAKALVQLVARGAVQPKDGKRLGVALSELERMEQTLTDYLSLARPLTDVTKEPVDLADLARGAAAVLEARAASQGVHLQVQAEPTPALADPRRLREALLNLSLNALQALPPGGTLTLGASRTRNGGRLVVADDGPGIPADQLDALFEPFVTTREGGTGLGLPLARSVARLHGGELRLESGPGRGTRAILDLPDDVP